MSDFIGIDYLPEVVTALEMETQDAAIRIETGLDSLGRIFITDKENGKVIEFNPLFCRDQFRIIAQHCEYWRERAEAEEQAREQAEAKGEVPEAVRPFIGNAENMADMTLAPIGAKVSPELERFALK